MEEDKDDLIMGFLDGTHVLSPNIEEVKLPLADPEYSPQNQ